MKTKEELEQIKEECSILNKKLASLSDDELKVVFGGINLDTPTKCKECNIEFANVGEYLKHMFTKHADNPFIVNPVYQ